jgi:hypothetical protein
MRHLFISLYPFQLATDSCAILSVAPFFPIEKLKMAVAKLKIPMQQQIKPQL